MNAIDKTKLYEKYQDRWVVLSEEDEVLVSGKTFDEVFKQAKTKGYDNPVIAKIPDLRYSYLLP